MSSGQSTVCTHDLGPGTKVCLRCRQEQREAARARQQRLLVKSGVVGLGLVFAYVAGAGAVGAVRGAIIARRNAEPPSMLATTEVVQQGAQQQGAQQQGAQQQASQQQTAPQLRAPQAATQPPIEHPASTPAAAPAPLSIAIPSGRTDAPDNVILERTADTVVVDFDTEGLRTRRHEKFERLVRETLPLVYGPEAEGVLKAVPDGQLGNGDLLRELPQHGIHLPLSGGWVLDLFPETRAGRDGPLVVSYRTNLRKS